MNLEGINSIRVGDIPVDYSICVISDPEELSKLKEEWDQLVLKDQHSTIFQSWAWNYWHSLNRSSEKGILRVLQIFNAEGELVGIVPLQLIRQRISGVLTIRKIEFIGTGDSDYLGIISKPGEEEVILKLLLQWLANGRKNWDIVNLQSLSKDSIFVRKLKKWRDRVPWKYSLTGEDVCPYIELNKMWPSLFGALPPSLGKYIKRKQRKIQKDKKVDFLVVRHPLDLKRYLGRFFLLHQQRMRKKSLPGFFQTEDQKEMFVEISQEFLKRDWLRFLVLEIDGEMAGGIYAFAFKDKYYFYQSGIDPRFKPYSLGYLLHYYLLEEAWKEGCKEYDFLRGNERFKQQWTEVIHQLFRLQMFSNPFKGFVYRVHNQFNRWLIEQMFFNKLYMMLKRQD